jgi:hypothetical protein
MTDKPRILLIDDEASETLLPSDIDPVLLRPDEDDFSVKLQSMLTKVDLVLLDQNLQLSGELSLQATDGASFVGHLRSWARNRRIVMPPLVIYTSEYEAFAEEIPAVGPPVALGGIFVGREAQIAPTLDVEWLIAKGMEASLIQIHALASACMDLRTISQNDRASLSEIQRFIALPEEPVWGSIAMEHLVRARPPVTEPGSVAREGARGATPVLRWLLHHALPYPSLFISDLHAAWTLGIEPECLQTIIERADTWPWAQELVGSIYAGPASALVSRRWWTAGVNFLAWKLRQEGERLGSFKAALEELAGPNLRVLEGSEQVVVVDMDFKEEGLAEIEQSVQLHPPGWPAEAVEPWMRRDLAAREPLVQSMLDPSDRKRLFK